MKSILLFIPALIYFLVTKIRNFFYDIKILKVRKVSVPVISIGNLTTGGTGKTPMTIYVAKKINHKQVAIVSRGYARKNPQKILKVLPKESNATDYFGDEPVEIANQGLNVYVSGERVKGCELAIRDLNPQVIVCDDAFQHRSLNRDLDILLIDATEPIDNYHILPLGNMRESFASISRANYIFVTKTNLVKKNHVDLIISKLTAHGFSKNRIFCYRYEIKNIFDKNNNVINISDIKHKKIGAFCGIGRPEGFLNSILNLGFNNPEIFDVRADHYSWGEKDIYIFKNTIKDKKIDFWLTTEKDYVKIRSWNEKIDASILRLALSVVPERDDSEVFNNFI